MKQAVRLMAYFGPRAEGRVAFDAVYPGIEEACEAFDVVKAALPGANMAFIGQDFEAAMAAMEERLAA
jgi:hypothetical protein